MTEDDANQPSPGSGRESPGSLPSDSSLDADQAMDLLNEMDAYITHLKHEHSDPPAAKKKPPPPKKKRTAAAAPKPPRPAPPTQASPSQPVDSQVQRTQDWVDDHTNALDARQERIENDAAALEMERADLTNLKVRLDQQSKALEQQRQALAKEKAQLAKARQQQPPGDTLGAGAINPNAAPAASQNDQAEIDQQKRRLQVQKRQIEQAYEKLKQKMAAFEKQRRAFDKQRLELEQQRLTQTARHQPQAPSNANTTEIEQQFRQRYEELKADEAVIDLARHQYAELLEQREVVVEAARYLPTVEEEMVRRWSTHRGVGLVGGAVSCLLFLLLFSYSVGQRIAHPVWRATTVVGVSASVFDESSYGTNWLTNTHQMLVGDDLLEEAIRLAAQRGGMIFDNVAAMRDALSQGMALELVSPGRILIEFRHTNPKLAVDVLNALGRAFVNHHVAEDRIAGRPNSMRTHRDAAVDPDPVEDRRLVASALTLGISTTAVAIIAAVLRWWLARSIRVFDREAIPELDQLDDPELWPTGPAGLDSDPSQSGDEPDEEDDPDTPGDDDDADDEQIELEEDAVLGQAIDEEDDDDDETEDRAA